MSQPMAAPETDERLIQRMGALETANARRFARAVIKRELKACDSKAQALALCADHIEDPDPVLAKTSAYDLIKSGYHCGESTALSALNAAELNLYVKIGQPGEARHGWLTDDQRETLVAVLRDPTAAPQRFNHMRLGPLPKPEPRVAVEPTPEPVATKEAPRPSLAHWCPTCAEYAIAMRDGTCGFCDTRITDAEAA